VSVLLVEDAPEIADLVRGVLEGERFSVTAVADGDSALAVARASAPDVVILDVSLPGIDGIEVCRQLRTFTDAYVVMLTGRAEETDRLVGLAVGADDYITKPFSPRELVARVRAMLRRPRASAGASDAPEDVRVFGELTIDPGAREVTVAGEVVELSRIEFELLDALSSHRRISLSRDQLLERVWGPNWFGDDHVIDVHVSNLRRKLGDDPRHPRFVRTVRGFGYRMGDG
jgi:DNA-binding response OmpR family regulator